MPINFRVNDVLHKIAVKFVHAYLPDAKKPYNLMAVHQGELDEHAIASKADIFNVTADPKLGKGQPPFIEGTTTNGL